MNLKPLNDLIIVEKLEDEVQPGQIYIPTGSTKAFTKAKVLAVGPGGISSTGTRIAPMVKTGDTVLMRNDRGSELKSRDPAGGRDRILWFVTERDFMAKVDEPT